MKRTLYYLSLIFITAAFSQNTFADERIRPRNVLLQEGYRPVVVAKAMRLLTLNQSFSIQEHSFEWPVAFQDAAHSVANVMAQFQPFDNPPYFHGGCDLRIQPRAAVTTPVRGRLEAGHYSYVTNDDGSMEKFFKPWPQRGDETYFEVAVIDENGTRFEFHHMDRSALAPEIVKMLNAGGGVVEAGTFLGRALYWPGGDYHHIHYNLILADGTRVNPEFASPLLADRKAPVVSRLLALSGQREVRDFGNGQFTQAPREFVAAVIDQQDDNVYEHPPAKVSLQFSDGKASIWDFRRTLSHEGKFPRLSNFFADRVRTPEGRTLKTSGGYGTGLSLIRIPVPEGARGDFKIEISDIAGNVTEFRGNVQ